MIDKKEWRNTACCLSMITYNEKSVRKLLEMFECFREKLIDPVIMDNFKSIEIKVEFFVFFISDYHNPRQKKSRNRNGRTL